MYKTMLRALPKQTLTAAVGSFSGHRASRFLIPWYVRHYQIDVSEAERPLPEYASLKDFFSRRLRPGVREVQPSGLISPVDGTVSELGRVEAGRLLQAKGCSYTLAALLGDARAAEPFYEGHYITLYLSPRDYHRIHMPVNGTVTRWRYIPGSLYPVNVSGVTHIDGLFTKNERLISFIESDRGSLAMVKVGATIVGSIRTPYGPAYAKPRQRQRHGILEGRPQLRLSRGEEVGYFEFGSTVILVMAPTVVSSFAVRAGDTVKMGETLAHLNPSIGVPMSE